ncbi:MAG: hypothetical protein D6724_08835 [Armatimonadetes bacterium]|nr:MAG: hypothetical protein D6724_08835 [Armatimonadota bacterium]
MLARSAELTRTARREPDGEGPAGVAFSVDPGNRDSEEGDRSVAMTRQEALVAWMERNPDEPIKLAMWEAAFDAGVQWARDRESEARSCPTRRALVHVALPGGSYAVCRGSLDADPVSGTVVPLAHAVSEATCPECLRMLWCAAQAGVVLGAELDPNIEADIEAEIDAALETDLTDQGPDR